MCGRVCMYLYVQYVHYIITSTSKFKQCLSPFLSFVTLFVVDLRWQNLINHKQLATVGFQIFAICSCALSWYAWSHPKETEWCHLLFIFFTSVFYFPCLMMKLKLAKNFLCPHPYKKKNKKLYPSISIAVAPRRALVDVNGTQLDGNGIKYESIRSFPQICLNSSFIKSYLRSIFKVRVDLRSIVILFWPCVSLRSRTEWQWRGHSPAPSCTAEDSPKAKWTWWFFLWWTTIAICSKWVLCITLEELTYGWGRLHAVCEFHLLCTSGTA